MYMRQMLPYSKAMRLVTCLLVSGLKMGGMVALMIELCARLLSLSSFDGCQTMSTLLFIANDKVDVLLCKAKWY